MKNPCASESKYFVKVIRIISIAVFLPVMVLFSLSVQCEEKEKESVSNPKTGEKIYMVQLPRPADLMHVPWRRNEEWMGIFREGKDLYLKKTRIITYKGQDNLTGAWVTVADKGETGIRLKGNILVTKGMDIEEGSVKTLYEDLRESTEERLIMPGKSLTIPSGACDYLIDTSGKLIISEEYGKKVENYELSVRLSGKESCDNSYKQTLYKSTKCESEWTNGCGVWDVPFIVWAGDMDRDNKTDLIILGDHDCFEEYEIWLSSLADKGKFLKKVASCTGWCY